MLLYGLIELLTKILWVCLLIRWFMEKLVTCLELEHKAHWAVKELNKDFKLAGKKRLLDLSSLDEWRNEAYENARLFKEKVNGGMIGEFSKGNFKLVKKFYYISLV